MRYQRWSVCLWAAVVCHSQTRHLEPMLLSASDATLSQCGASELTPVEREPAPLAFPLLAVSYWSTQHIPLAVYFSTSFIGYFISSHDDTNDQTCRKPSPHTCESTRREELTEIKIGGARSSKGSSGNIVYGNKVEYRCPLRKHKDGQTEFTW